MGALSCRGRFPSPERKGLHLEPRLPQSRSLNLTIINKNDNNLDELNVCVSDQIYRIPCFPS